MYWLLNILLDPLHDVNHFWDLFEAIIIQKAINFLIQSYKIDLVSCLLNILLDPLHDVNHLREIQYGHYFSTWEEMKNRPPNKTYREPKKISEIKSKSKLQFWYATLQKYSNGLTWTVKVNDQNTHYTHKISKNVKPSKLPIY